MIYIGIDPGLKGAIAHIDSKNGYQASGIPMPITGIDKGSQISMDAVILHLRALGSFENNLQVFLESAQSMPKQGGASMFKFGMVYGQIQGILAAIKIPFTLVNPTAWKKLVLAGLPWKGNKAASIQFCQRKYPEYCLLRNPTDPRCKPNDGLADALCIARYGLSLVE